MPPSLSRRIVIISSRTDGQYPRREADGMAECFALLFFFFFFVVFVFEIGIVTRFEFVVFIDEIF